MPFSTAQRPRCCYCRVGAVGKNRHKLCKQCLLRFRCVVCGGTTLGKSNGSWCKRCQEISDICRALRVRCPGVRPDDETLAYRLTLYAFRAEQQLPLFEPPTLF